MRTTSRTFYNATPRHSSLNHMTLKANGIDRVIARRRLAGWELFSAEKRSEVTTLVFRRKLEYRWQRKSA
jgi:hypothetical protein